MTLQKDVENSMDESYGHRGSFKGHENENDIYAED